MALSQRLLGLPAWSWPLISVALITTSMRAPWPGPAANPAAGLFREPILVTRTASEHKVVPFGRHEGIGPVWAVSLRSTDRASVHRRFGSSPDSKTPGLGFFHRRDQWSYELAANRLDAESRQAPPESLWMSQEEANALRPLVVAELERRTGTAQPRRAAGDTARRRSEPRVMGELAERPGASGLALDPGRLVGGRPPSASG